ncbi:arabinosyltransferase domain-containing protein [Amycolatopsis nigrescens]|uniref:arabinosyltransferase domain-containing protein n=1 Tax=Amycolatopsis nigrescens TaxID=381445 RepID=UPI00037EAC09|nr:arabinosyltransferase domain-containing protein [Amycolatopsis nigrescens]
MAHRPAGTPAASFRWLLGLALATIALAIAIPFAPVRGDRIDVDWPKAGQAPEPTVAMFMPYRPLRLDVDLACSVVASAEPGDSFTAFSSFPPDSDKLPNWGLALTVRDRQLFLTTANQEHALGGAPGTDCTYQVRASEHALVAGLADGRELVRVDTRVPQVAAFVTELPAEEALGKVAARAEADARFQTAPTPLKLGLMIGCGLGVLGCLIAGFRVFRSTVRPRDAAEGPRRWVDAVWTGLVATGIAGWGVLGAQTVDDGWFLGMHRNLDSAGFAGDYYMALNAAETPAVLLQHLFAPLFQLSWAPLVVRGPSMLAGLASWLLMLGIVRLLRRYTDAPKVPHWLLAAAFFVAWMPGGLGLRPEPFVTLCLAVSGYAAVRAKLTETPAWLIVGGVAAGLSLTVTSTGMLAVIPLVLGLVHACRRLEHTRTRALLVTLTLAAMTVAAPIVFVNSGLGGFLDSAGARFWYGASSAWYNEFNRYQAVLGQDVAVEFTFEQHPFRRLPVLLGIGMMLIVLVLRLRNRQDSTFAGPFGWPFAWLGAGLAMLVLTPTKVASHFSALAFATALVLAFGLAGLPRAFGRERAGWVVRLGALFLVTLLVSVSMNGVNSWWGYQRLGMTGLEKPLFDGVPANPLVILATGAVVAVVPLTRRLPPDGASWPVRFAGWTAIGIAGVALLAMPVLTAGLLGTAALNQYGRGSWSTTAANLHSITDSTCGAADAVRVRDGGTDRSLTEVLAGQPGPAIVDWPISFWYPCARLPVLADGLLEPPAVMVVAPGGYRYDGDLTRSYQPHGGVFAPITEVAEYRELPSELLHNNDPDLWGPLLEIDYRYRTDGFEVRRSTAEQPGWQRGPGYATKEYVGQDPPS